MSQRRSKRTTSAVHALWPIWAICGLLVFGMIAVYVSVSLSERPKASDIPVLDVPETSEIVLHTADFGQGQLRLFHLAGTGITFAVKRLSDRHVHAALSSCTVCSRQGHKSYAKKNEMFCGICNQNMRFENEASAQKSAKGQCPLPEIPVLEKDGEVAIALKDLVRVADQALMK
jgi:uncharacterized membrane protein